MNISDYACQTTVYNSVSCVVRSVIHRLMYRCPQLQVGDTVESWSWCLPARMEDGCYALYHAMPWVWHLLYVYHLILQQKCSLRDSTRISTSHLSFIQQNLQIKISLAKWRIRVHFVHSSSCTYGNMKPSRVCLFQMNESYDLLVHVFPMIDFGVCGSSNKLEFNN